jgi:hypothetical protein
LCQKEGYCQNGRLRPKTAKMAATANFVPKSNGMPFATSKSYAKVCQKFFRIFLIFFSCIDDTTLYNRGIRKREKDEDGKG